MSQLDHVQVLRSVGSSKYFGILFLLCPDDGKRNPVPVDMFPQHVEVMSANDNYLFANEFEVSLLFKVISYLFRKIKCLG